MSRIAGLLALFSLSACAGASDYHAVSSYVIAGTNLVYVSVGKRNTNLTSCKEWTAPGCLTTDSGLVYTDARLVAIDANLGTQHDLVVLAQVDEYATHGLGTFTRSLLPNPTPWAKSKGAADLRAVNATGRVAYFWYDKDGVASPALLMGPEGSASVNVGSLPQTIHVAADEVAVTVVSPAPLQVAQFRWEGPVDTRLEDLQVATGKGERGFEFVSLSPAGSRLLLRTLDLENGGSTRTRFVILALPSGDRITSLDFETPAEIEWIGEGHLALNTIKPRPTTLIYDIATAQRDSVNAFVDLKNKSPQRGSDLLITQTKVLTPEGKITPIDVSGGRVVDGRLGWGINVEGEIIAYDFDRETSRSLGRINLATKLIGKTHAGLIVFDHRTPAQIWTVNPDHGARRNILISTTTANGLEEVSGY